jgi:WD40 repeat protein
MDSTSARTLCEVKLPGGLDRFTYSRDGRFIATCVNDPDTVNVWDAQTGQRIATYPGTIGHPPSMSFGSEGLLALAGYDGTIQFWEVPTGIAKPLIRAGGAAALGMTFDPAGTALATIGSDCAVRLWDTATGQLIRQFGLASGRWAPHTTDALAFDPDGSRLASVRGDGTVTVWEIATGTEVFRLRGHTRAINAIAYSPDGRRIATASDDFTIKLWDAANGDEVLTLRGHTGFVLGLDFSPDGNRLLSASADGTVRAWDTTRESN